MKVYVSSYKKKFIGFEPTILVHEGLKKRQPLMNNKNVKNFGSPYIGIGWSSNPIQGEGHKAFKRHRNPGCVWMKFPPAGNHGNLFQKFQDPFQVRNGILSSDSLFSQVIRCDFLLERVV